MHFEFVEGVLFQWGQYVIKGIAVVESRMNEALETPHVREDEGERCGGMETADVRDDKYEVNH